MHVLPPAVHGCRLRPSTAPIMKEGQSVRHRTSIQNRHRALISRTPRVTVAQLFLRAVRRWQSNRAINELSRLDDRQLEDIGISRNRYPEGGRRSLSDRMRFRSAVVRRIDTGRPHAAADLEAASRPRVTVQRSQRWTRLPRRSLRSACSG